MPPKTKRQWQLEKNLEKARDVKKSRSEGEGEAAIRTQAEVRESSGLANLLAMSDDALDTDDEETDPSFSLDASLKEDTDHLFWVTQG